MNYVAAYQLIERALRFENRMAHGSREIALTSYEKKGLYETMQNAHPECTRIRLLPRRRPIRSVGLQCGIKKP